MFGSHLHKSIDQRLIEFIDITFGQTRICIVYNDFNYFVKKLNQHTQTFRTNLGKIQDSSIRRSNKNHSTEKCLTRFLPLILSTEKKTINKKSAIT